ncbi:MAG: efflux RND transporter periplasmic adaptor subunit [Planctomycetia bacterium]|nr:efflux RND transporter periplasmic adaptor subunit [Planctomycetia bacterium]
MKSNTFLNYFSLFLTALFIGGMVGFGGTYYYQSIKLSDEKYVQGILEQFKDLGKNTVKNPIFAAVRVEKAVMEEAQEISELTGRLMEINRTTVASEVTGRIVEMFVEEGTPVETGRTLLARVDTVWSKLAIQQSQARLAALEATLRYESSELKRISSLIADHAVSQSEVESKEATIQELRAQIAEEHAALKEWELRVTRSEIFAPFHGEVVQRFVDVGSYVVPGTAIAEIISTGQIDARIFVPENDIHRVSVGQKVQVMIDPLNKMVEGSIVTILGSAETASRTFVARIRLDDNNGELKSGMSVRAYLPVTDKVPSLVLPEDAVLIRPDDSTVWVALSEEAQNGQEAPEIIAEPVPVRITATMPGKFAVEPETQRGKEILVAGADVIIEGAERLAPGTSLRIMENKYPIQSIPGLYPSGHQKLD